MANKKEIYDIWTSNVCILKILYLEDTCKVLSAGAGLLSQYSLDKYLFGHFDDRIMSQFKSVSSGRVSSSVNI